jgi:hypothetical protein
MKPVQSNLYSVLLAPAASATTARTANLDTTGANYASIVVSLSAEVNTNSTHVAIQLSESDTTVATTFATFNASFNQTLDNTAAIVHASHVDLKGRKKFLRLTLTPDTTTNGAVLSSAVGVLDPGLRNALNSANSTQGVAG